MINAEEPLIQLKITTATCSFLAVATTVYRLLRRRHKLWADDAWALFALLALIIQVIAVFLRIPIPNSQSGTARITAYYLMAFTFYTIIWASRLSILFSIIRLDPSERRRKQLFWVAVSFVAVVILLFAQLLWICETQNGWKDCAQPPVPPAPRSRNRSTHHVTADVLADLTLLIAPIALFRDLADNLLRRKLTLIFSTCVVTTIVRRLLFPHIRRSPPILQVSLVHAAYILQNGGIKVLISAVVEDNISLIVANTPVVVATLFNLTGDQDQVTTTGNSLSFSTRLHFLSYSSRGSVLATTVQMNTLKADAADVPLDVEANKCRPSLCPRKRNDADVVPSHPTSRTH
ncbi:hypothetical protein C8J57DRAFT_1532663 [Mycena rebaudengoi]|nr:hypothetical protein C8J57DRAFT_1532663 [Mycena rebaudengoi]